MINYLSALDNFVAKLRSLFGDTLFNVLSGLITIIIGLIIAKFIRYILKHILFKLPINQTIAKFMTSILSALVYLIYFLIVVDAFGIPMSGFITLIGSIGVAIGLALKDSLSNIANGMLLVGMQPFKVGDFVNVNGVEGTVIGIHLVTTVIQTTDNKVISIPNNEVLANNIINFNGMTTRRLDLTYSVAYDTDIDLVKTTLLKMCHDHVKILKDPSPLCRLANHGDSSLDFLVRVWVKADDYWNVKFDLNEEVIRLFNELEIEIPYNQLDVRMR